MEDDLTFGTSVWGAPEPSLLPPLVKPKPPSLPLHDGFISAGDDEFDDFDDFGPAETAAVQDIAADDDDFGDFGDFGEEVPATPTDFSGQPVAGPSTSRIETDWEPLDLDPLPDRRQLEQDINDILDPVWDDEQVVEQALTKDGIRDVEGVNQILVTNERYDPLLPCIIALILFAVGNCTKFSLEHHPQQNHRTGLDLGYEGST